MPSRRHHMEVEKRKPGRHLRYYDNSGYYDNQQTEYNNYAPPLRYHGNNRYLDGRYRANGKPDELQDEKKRNSEFNWKRAVLISIIIFVVLILACATVGIIFAVKNRGSESNRSEADATESFDGDVVLVATAWEGDLSKPDSPAYKQMEEIFVSDMDELFTQDPTTAGSYNHTTVTQFRPGSVRVLFRIVFNVQVATDATGADIETIISIDMIMAVLINSTKFDTERLEVKKTPDLPESQSPTSTITTSSSMSTSTSSSSSISSSTATTASTSTATSKPPSSTSTSTSSTVTTASTSTQTSEIPSSTSSSTSTSSTVTTATTSAPTSTRPPSTATLTTRPTTSTHSTTSSPESSSSQTTSSHTATTLSTSSTSTESQGTDCTDGEFKCLIYEECIDDTKHCDGIEHCKDRSDEWFECGQTQKPWVPNDLEVRLVDGEQDSLTKGRVEVRRRGIDEDFGTVCGEGWSMEDATVVCRMINPDFAGTAYAYNTAVFGEGTGPILMSKVICHGNESNLGDCISYGFGYGLVHCSHAQDASVSCDGIQIPTSPVPVATGPDSEVRLIRGRNCLEGLLQVYYDEDWPFVCADLFESTDATVVCRTLGYNAGAGSIFYSPSFGPGDGLYWTVDVNCKGDESHIFNCTVNPWGENDCTVWKAVGMQCAGDLDIDCESQEPCVSRINCNFETDDCCYKFTPPEDEGEGTSSWVRYSARQINQVDHTENNNNGKILYYQNMYGEQNDFAYLELPKITLKDEPQKLEFYYLIQHYGSNALSLELETDVTMVTDVWQSTYVTKEMERIWIYGCWNVHQQENLENATLRFIGRRGPLSTRVIALDDVSFAGGFCEDISSKRCDFDESGSCNARVICDNCDQEYRWRWTNNDFDSDDQSRGYYMLADASYGRPGNKARMEFRVFENTKAKRGLKFKYRFIGLDDGYEDSDLKVVINSNDTTVIWQSKTTAEKNVWHIACSDIPNTIDDLKLTFEATRGDGIFDDIALDDVELIDYCPYPGSCDFEEGVCGYEVDAYDPENFTWDTSGKGGAIAFENHMTGRFIQLYDNDAPYGSWAKLVSPVFNITDGPYKLTFHVSKFGPGKLQVYLTSNDVTYSLGIDISPMIGHTDGAEIVCVNLRDISLENAQLVFEAIKGSDWNAELYANRDIVSIDSIEIAAGECSVSRSCTFEEDHRLCDYMNFNDQSETSNCDTKYLWRRRGGKYDDGSVEDQTVGDKTGHVLAVSTAYGDNSSTATVRFRMVNSGQGQNMHVMMFYKILREIKEESSLWLSLGKTEVDLTENYSTLNGWKPVCGHVFAGANGTIAFNITAKDIDAAIDDVSLESGFCPEQSVNCSFDDPFLCGYTVEVGGRFEYLSNESFVRVSKSGTGLISPSFSVTEDSEVCLSIDIRSSVNMTIEESPYLLLSLYNEIDGTSLLLRYNRLPVTYSHLWRLQYIQLSIPAAQYHLIFTGNLGNHDYIDIKSVHLNYNDCPKLDCPIEDIPCDGDGYTLCMPSIDACQQQDICSTETAAECLSSIDCDFNDIYSCGWTLREAAVEDHSLVLGGVAFSYAETPVMEITTQSCLSFTLFRDFNDNLLRIVQNTSNSLLEVDNFSLFKAQGRKQELKVNLPAGRYSLIFEARHDGMGGAYLHIDSVSVSEGMCVYSGCPGTSCSFDDDSGHSKSVCFQDDDVFCDKYVDCPTASDEDSCEYSFSCNFDTSTCGYDVSEGMKHVKTPYKMKDIGVTIRSSDGGENDFVLIYDSTQFEQSEFTTGALLLSPETCEIEYDVSCHIDPLVNASDAFAHLVINITDEYRRPYLYEVKVNITSEWSKYSIPINEIFTNLNRRKGRFVPTFKFSGKGVIIATDNIKVTNCFEKQTTTSTPNTTAFTPETNSNLPADFPDVVIPDDTLDAHILDKVDLSCSIDNPANYESVLYWYKDDDQISRDTDIINQKHVNLFGHENVEIDKYDVTSGADDTRSSVTYTLTINRITDDDVGLYTCKLFANGQSNGDSVQVMVVTDVYAQTDDLCYKSTIPICHDLGFQKVLTPGHFGIYDISEASLRLQSSLDNSILYEGMSEQCRSTVFALQCGMYSSTCLDGEDVPICREHCEDIVNNCLLQDSHGDLFTSLQYSCKFLPYASEFASCLPIFKGCGLTYTAPNGRIMTENYPHPYPLDTDCDWYIEVDPYHVIMFDVIEYDIGDTAGSNEECGLYIYDETIAQILANVTCGEQLLPLNSTGNNVTLRFHSDSISTGSGFIIKYKQTPVDACFSFSGESNVTVSSETLLEETCKTFKVYLQDERDTLVIKVLFLTNGCINIYNNVEHSIDEQICNITTAQEYRTKGYVNIHADSEEVIYEIMAYKVVYERSVSSVLLDERGRLEITSEGTIGGFCGALDNSAGAVLCKSLGLGWPAFGTFDRKFEDELPPIASDIICTGEEEDITKCRFSFDLTTDFYCYILQLFGLIQTVTCQPRSISCDFRQSTCGYILGKNIQLSEIYGLYISPTSLATGTMASPKFSYSEGVKLHFEYSICRAVGARLSINLVDTLNNTTVVLWEWGNYAAYGNFKGCVRLPTPIYTEDIYQIVTEYSSGEIIWKDISAEYTGIQTMTLSFETCDDEDARLLCEFENVDSCVSVINMKEIACNLKQDGNRSTVVTSGVAFSRGKSWIKSDHTYGSVEGHFLLINEGTSISLVNLSEISAENRYFRFYYVIDNGLHISYNTTMTLEVGGEEIYQVQKLGSGWLEACVNLTGFKSQQLMLIFGGDLEHTSASLAVDDISFSSVPCAYYLNCHFEDDCRLRFHSTAENDTQYRWTREKSEFGFARNNGYYMKAGFDYTTAEGDIAVLESDNLLRSESIECLQFQYSISGTDNPGSLHVKLHTGNDSRDIFVAYGNQGDDWITFQVPIDGEVLFLQCIATQGNGMGTILLDNVEFTTRPCNTGLNDVEYCSFDNPVLCGLRLSESSNWKRGSPGILQEGVNYDADFDENGYFYFIKPAELSSNNKENYITFDVSGTPNIALQFSYMSIGGSSTPVYVNINGQQQMVSIDIEDHWVLSDCIELPDQFEGEIEIGVGNEETETEFIAIDHLQLAELTKCRGPTLSCDFTSGDSCSYKSPGNTWKLADTLTSTASGIVIAPTVLLSTSYCYVFLYSVMAVDSVDEQPTLYLYGNGEEIWKTDGNIRPETSIGQITLRAAVTDLQFRSEGKGSYKLFEIYIKEGECENISDCTEFVCGDKCISVDRKCDKTVDCVYGEDEEETLCGFKLFTDFATVTDLRSTGFQTSDTSYVAWKLEPNATVIINDTEKFIQTPSLITRFTTPLARPSILESFEYHLEEDSCLQINYFGDVAYGKIQLRYQNNAVEESEFQFNIKPGTDMRHISVPVTSGDVRLFLYVYMFEVRSDMQGEFPDSSVFVIKQIIMHAGKSCDALSVECAADMKNICLDKRSCYSDDEKCDAVANCFDESDETEDCGYEIVCDFERPDICGYSNISPRRTYIDYRFYGTTLQTVWERIASSSITRPTTDHTFQTSGEGHFVTSKNNEGLLDNTRYVDVETMQSPLQTFEDDGCITFWYYLNSTDHQPKTTSAQIFVYIQYEDTGEKLLLWYDHINRPFLSWVKGGLAVYGNRAARLIVTAKTSIPFDAFTGVVSFDDVNYSEGNCDISKLECDADMHKCGEDGVCIPDSFVCDGEADCQDGSDERFCDRPNGSLKLVGGDGSYGKLAYYYDRAWRPVCYPNTVDEQNLFKLNTAHHVCRELGFIGNFDSFKYKLWEKYSAINIELYCSDDNECEVNMTSAPCDQYTYIRCSNEVCFSDEVVCPGTRSTCIPMSYLCDGQQDCPDNMDETACYCYKDEVRCIHTIDECSDKTCETCEERGMFECFDHECIPLKHRCDGRRDCGDASDEYRCVQIEDNNFEVSVFMNTTLTREIVCVDDIRFEEADMLCQLAGQGDVAEIASGFERIMDGVNLVTFEPMANCFPLRLKCHMPECGTTVIQDNLIEPVVINGRDASIEEWPWYGFLRLNGTFICGLSLIDPLWAITASHCFGNYGVYVVYTVSFGTDNTGSDGEWQQEIPVEEMFEYGYISSTWIEHDITLLKLKYPALINNFTRPVCVPTLTSLDNVRSQGPFAECFVVGLGTSEKLFADPTSRNVLPDVLQKKQVQVLTKEYCEESWTTLNRDGFPENVVCVGTESPSSPLCFGDSGGPLVCKANSGRWELFGLVSFGYGSCFHDLIPTVLTSVANYREWIKDVTENLTDIDYWLEEDSSVREKMSECQTAWNLIRRRVTRHLVRIQAVCKGLKLGE